ncbi:hypothetical protein E2C01_081283 [Portunus trituberculatus]|uniref:Uncharacterized protein n=1 Tax=Portunus trituberculatus TaxID=210409 RepID=A0A5B7J1W0_PORTR|nr:hypothetical protein [Portunus trituberculatus]
MACGRVLWAAGVLTWVLLLTGESLAVALPEHYYYGKPTVHEQGLHSIDGGAETAEHSTSKRSKSNNQDLGDQVSNTRSGMRFGDFLDGSVVKMLS